MEFTFTQDFPAGLKTLWATFGSRDYPLQKYRALGADAIRIGRFCVGDKCIEVELERDLPVRRGRLPLWARALVGRRQTLTHCSKWQRVGTQRIDAVLDIKPVGVPVRAHGVGSLVEAGKGRSHMVLTWQVDSVLGDRVARVFADEVRAALEDDHAFTLGYLERAAAQGLIDAH